MKDNFKIRSYDVQKYPFINLYETIFDCSDLKNIHNIRKDLFPQHELVFDNESQTKYHKTFYEKVNNNMPEFHIVYDDFIRNEITPIIGEEFVVQYQPSFRVHLPNNQCVHKWHYDSDPDHHHPVGEINFHLAITDIFGTNAVWVESEPGKADYKPMELKIGEYIQFNGNKLTHGNKINTTEYSRMSFDFRVLPKKLYDEENALSSITSGTKFTVGSYYKEVKSS